MSPDTGTGPPTTYEQLLKMPLVADRIAILLAHAKEAAEDMSVESSDVEMASLRKAIDSAIDRIRAIRAKVGMLAEALEAKGEP